MYNHYIPQTGPAVPPEPAGQRAAGPGAAPDLLGRLWGKNSGENRAGQALSALLKHLHLERLDAGDLLLGLIVLFLVLEDGDDLDVLITLALTILLSLEEK